jgi:ribosome-associated heat shock protein Hsp15
LTEPADRLRLDKWLWHARVVRTRVLAQELARSGHVRINGERVASASRPVRIGDVLTIALDRTVRVLEVAGFGARRGPAPEAQSLFVDRSPAPPDGRRDRGLASDKPGEH